MTEPVSDHRSSSATPVLEIKDPHAWYGVSHILHGVNLTVNKGRGGAACWAATVPAVPPRCAPSWA